MSAPRIVTFSQLPCDHDAFDVTNERAMKAMRDAEARHFWHRSRNELIVDRLVRLGVGPGTRFLELGCGGGCVSAYLSSAGWNVVGVEGHRGLVEQAAARAPQAAFWVHDLSQGVDALPREPFGAAGLFDVLEHVASPVGVLESAVRMVVRGGRVVGTVPAMMSLWSRTDEQAGHRTRYDLARLRALLEAVPGCSVEEIVPFNRVLVPLMRVRKWVVANKRGVADVAEANFRIPPLPLNEGMLWMLRVERALAAVLPLGQVAGSSLWFAVRTR